MPKLEKGSEAARQRMAHLRSLKKSKAAVNGENDDKSNKVEGKGGTNVTGRRRRVAPPNANVAPAPTNVNDVDVDLPDTFDIDDGRTQHEVTAHHTTEVNHMPHSRVANALPLSDSELANIRRRRQTLLNKITQLNSQINNAENAINNYRTFRTHMDTNDLNRQIDFINTARGKNNRLKVESITIRRRLEPIDISNAELAPNNIVNNAEPFVEEGSGIKNNFSVEYTKMPKLEKGSAAAKERMAHLRSLRKAKTIKGTGDNGNEKPEKMGLARAISISPRASLNSNTPFINENPNIASAENVHLHPQERHENARLHLEYETRLQAIKNRMLYIKRELELSAVLTTKQRNKYMENWTDLEQERQQLEKLLQDESIEGIAIKQPVVAKFQETDGTGTKKSPWILHVSKYAKTHGISYFQALKMPEVREEYKKAK